MLIVEISMASFSRGKSGTIHVDQMDEAVSSCVVHSKSKQRSLLRNKPSDSGPELIASSCSEAQVWFE